MRTLGDEFSAALDADIIYPIFFYEAEFASGTLHLWTGFGDRVWDGKTWSGIGWLIGLSTVEETTDTQSTSMTIGLNANSEIVALALAEVPVSRNRPMTIWMGLLSDGAALGDPDLDFALGDPDAGFALGSEAGDLLDVQPLFAGLCDIAEVDVDPGAPAVRIKYSSKIADLERARVRRQTDADQQIDCAGDRFFEYVGPLSDAVINWGLTG